MDPTQIPTSLVELAKDTASKPISSFSEFISLKLFGKTNAKLRAEAENEYDKVRQKGEIERRVNEPLIVQLETAKAQRQYANLGSTLQKAAPLITAPKPRITDDDDVFWGLLEHAKEISSAQMQALISKIIAGEYNSPGTYTMSTLQTVKMLGKNELELMEKLASLTLDNKRIPEQLFRLTKNEEPLMNKLQLDFGSLQTAQSLGLILPNEMTRSIQNPNGENFETHYFHKLLIFAPENKEKDQEISLLSFFSPSPVGQQILQHLNPQYNEGFYQWLRENYKIPNYKLIN